LVSYVTYPFSFVLYTVLSVQTSPVMFYFMNYFQN